MYINLLWESIHPNINLSYPSMPSIFSFTLFPGFSAVNLHGFLIREQQQMLFLKVKKCRAAVEPDCKGVWAQPSPACGEVERDGVDAMLSGVRACKAGAIGISESSVRLCIYPTHHSLVLYLSCSKYVNSSRNWSCVPGSLGTPETRNTKAWLSTSALSSSGSKTDQVWEGTFVKRLELSFHFNLGKQIIYDF